MIVSVYLDKGQVSHTPVSVEPVESETHYFPMDRFLKGLKIQTCVNNSHTKKKYVFFVTSFYNVKKKLLVILLL